MLPTDMFGRHYKTALTDVIQAEFKEHLNGQSAAGSVITGNKYPPEQMAMPGYDLQVDAAQFAYTKQANDNWTEDLPVKVGLRVFDGLRDPRAYLNLKLDWDIGRPVYKVDVSKRPYRLSITLESILKEHEPYDEPRGRHFYNEFKLEWDVSITEPTPNHLNLRIEGKYTEELEWFYRGGHALTLDVTYKGVYDGSTRSITWKDADGAVLDEDPVFDDGTLSCVFPLQALTKLIAM